MQVDGYMVIAMEAAEHDPALKGCCSAGDRSVSEKTRGRLKTGGGRGVGDIRRLNDFKYFKSSLIVKSKPGSIVNT